MWLWTTLFLGEFCYLEIKKKKPLQLLQKSFLDTMAQKPLDLDNNFSMSSKHNKIPKSFCFPLWSMDKFG